MTDLEKKIKKSLDEYLEFDSNIIFNNTDYLVIYGGAIRDIIASDDIHDIDIMCLPKSMDSSIKELEKLGYNYIDLYSKNILSLYKEISVIFEPRTYINSNLKKIQFIKPNVSKMFRMTDISRSDYFYKKSFFNLLQAVDLSCCGVFWDGENLYESITGSVRHCIEKKFVVYDDNYMYNPSRIEERKYKLFDRGWDEIINRTELRKTRTLKMDKILSEYPQNIGFMNKLGFSENEFIEINSHKSYNFNDDLPF